MIRIMCTVLLLVVCASSAQALTTEALLDTLQHTAFNFFWNEANPTNGLIKDRSTLTSPCSIASVGFGLTAICIGIDHGWVSRTDGRDRVLTTLNTFWTKPQGSGASGTIGYQGFFYHFLDMNTALRTWSCELSTIDTALLFAGMLDTKQYFNTSDPGDIQVRTLVDQIYQRADWQWFRNLNPGIFMGWKPGTGFSGYGQWTGYNEAMILYILALGSPTHPVTSDAWTAWTSGYTGRWNTYYGYTYLNFPPLFGHQYSHCWVDFRGRRDTYMQGKGINYFENSRRATLAQRAYCIANPGGWTGYGENLWGITACDRPSGYGAAGAPPAQNDDGTIAPTAPAGSIAFSPGEVIPVLHNMYDTYNANLWGPYGFKDAFNLTVNWWDTDYIGIDEGPIIIMIENFRTESVWSRFMQSTEIQLGLQQAGFVATTDIAENEHGLSAPCILLPNSPNPFRESTTIRFDMAAPGHVTLTLADPAGREVRRLLDGEEEAGVHAVTLRGEGLPSGTYFYRLLYDDTTEAKKCVLIR